jgi:hypothetical protein
MGIVGDTGFVEGHNINGAKNRWDAEWSPWDRLIRFPEASTSSSQPQPMLAESCDADSKLTRIKFNLAKACSFTTGANSPAPTSSSTSTIKPIQRSFPMAT